MTRRVFTDELTASERERLLSDPYSEIRSTVSGRLVIEHHKLDDRQFFWLAKELGYKPWSDELCNVLDAIERNEPVYSVHFKKKRNGGPRKILAPNAALKSVQRRILDNILVGYPVSPSAFGYSGGSVFDTIAPHIQAENKSLFSTDIEDAFGSVCFSDIFHALYGLPMDDNYEGRKEKGYLSWEVAFALCRLTTCGESLPQGAPSSPRIFDMVFLPLDRRLESLAQNVGGVYTRFADNIYFSMSQEDFPDVIARAIIRTVHQNKNKRDSFGLMDAKRFYCHKTRNRPLGTEAVRILGVNVADGKIYPTRQLKQRIKLSIHRMNWLLSNTPYDIDSITKCWQTLRGQISFASQAILPERLLDEYEFVKGNLERMILYGEVPETR